MTVHRKTLQAQGIQWALLLPSWRGRECSSTRN